jgi:hypothetical protein
MSVRFRVFASGLLTGIGSGPPGEYYTLYRVPDGKSVVVNAMRFTNAGATSFPVTFTIALKRENSGPPGEIIIFPDARNAALGPYKMAVEDREFPLAATEEIRGRVDPTYSKYIHFIICGVERDM